MRKLFAVLVVIPLVTGCSLFAAKRDAGYEQSAGGQSASGADSEEIRAQADEAWAARDDQASLEKAIDLYAQAAAAAPQNVELYERLSRATYFLADAHLRDKAKRQEEVYHESIAWGERCLATDPDFKAKVDGGAKVEDAAEGLGAEYAGCIYWQAAALGKWATLKGFATRVANKDRIKKLVEKVTTARGDYFYGAADRYWGAYYAILPGFMGKDLKKSRAHFEASLQQAPNYLGTKVLMAERLATELSDRAMFKSLLDEVIAADAEVDAEIAPENKAEQLKAKELLAKIDDQVPE